MKGVTQNLLNAYSGTTTAGRKAVCETGKAPTPKHANK